MSSSPMPSVAWITLDQVIVTETSVPLAFTEEDILHYVLIEQAQLFPTLDQAIYFDFFVKSVESVEEETKKIVIAACNVNDVEELTPTIFFLKIDHKDFEKFNLLPWRQRDRKLEKKGQLKILAGAAIISSMFMLAISLYYVHRAHQDKERAIDFSHRKHVIISQLNALEHSNQDVQAHVYRWEKQINHARHQLDLEKLLRLIEEQRPENIVLDNILWRENILSLKGRSKKAAFVKIYLNNLIQANVETQLAFMGNSVDQEFSVQFEMEIVGAPK